MNLVTILRSLGRTFALGALAVPLVATTVEPPDFAELVRGSDFVVRARVKSVEPEARRQQGRALIFTRVTVEVLEVIAGEPPAPLVLTLLGGRLGEDELVVEGVPTFAVGDEDILFVQGNGVNFHPLYAVMHGRYPVKHDAATGRAYVTRNDGVPLADVAEVALPLGETGAPAARLQRRLRAPADALTPAEFAQHIRQVRTGGAQAREK